MDSRTGGWTGGRTDGRAEVTAWLNADLCTEDPFWSGPLGQHGQHFGAAQFSLRWLGRPAESGRRQLLITLFDQETAMLVFAICYKWWSMVSEAVDIRGWRMCSVRWFRP